METTMQLDCLLDYPYFNQNSKLIAIDLSRKEALDTDPRAIQQVNFIENLDRAEGAWMVFILEKVKKGILDFSQGTVRLL